MVPADALPLLRAGRLDERLFDLTADRGGELPLLLMHPKAKTASRQARTAATVPGAHVRRDLPAVGALADRGGRAALWRSLTRVRP